MHQHHNPECFYALVPYAQHAPAKTFRYGPTGDLYRRPMRVPEPQDTRWGSRANRFYKRKSRRPGLTRFLTEFARMQIVYSGTHQIRDASANRAHAVASSAFGTLTTRAQYFDGEHVPAHPEWARPHVTLLQKHGVARLPASGYNGIHFCVIEALKRVSPDNMRILLMHLPHVSKEDSSKLCFAQSYDKLARDLWTRTTPGKYLRAMFSALRDEEISEIVSLYEAEHSEERFGIVGTYDEFIEVLLKGPQSCMSHGPDDYDSAPHHPYAVYAPELGWRMAYMRTRPDEDGPEYYSRALVNEVSKAFVRTFRYGGTPGSYSHDCPRLDAWLRSRGYEHRCGWHGHKIARLSGGSYGRYVMPYVDGSEQHIYEGSVDYLTIGRTAATPNVVGEADSTTGLINGADLCECEACGHRSDEDDDWYWVGQSENMRVCRTCQQNNYTFVTGRRGRGYYVENDEAVFCESDDNYYHESYLHDNGVYQCQHDDRFYKDVDMFKCEQDDEMYSDDAPHIVLPNGYRVYLDNAQAHFRGDRDAFAEWWRDGHHHNDTLPHEALRDFVADVEGDPTALAEDDDLWETYEEVCQEIGRTPIDRPIEDEDEDAVSDADTNEINTTEGA